MTVSNKLAAHRASRRGGYWMTRMLLCWKAVRCSRLKSILSKLAVDDGFIPTYGIKMESGRNFSKDIKTDSNKFIINETTVETLGWKTPENALNKQMKIWKRDGQCNRCDERFSFRISSSAYNSDDPDKQSKLWPAVDKDRRA